ncbi:MAG: deoxyribose-phosphate aldolase [Megasphaera sp.]|jgi:deoxyribose-phosphate aldolase|nr:deoxyribose-phosphate aldolase [Megasphaera sp.]MCH4188059.1 deoxyribose-phosphate aldolase [Megasphaera sp.]
MDISSCIEHTNLKPEATPADIEQLCREAREYHFGAVCVNSSYVQLAHHLLAGSTVHISCVVGFPLGAMATKSKAAETAEAVASGADEIDMVMSIGRAKAGDWDYVTDDIRQVVTAAAGHAVKVILETGLLTENEKVRACQAAVAAGAAFVKTSTGFGHGGAVIADVQLMKRTVGGNARIKASGGIRDYATAAAMLAAGADRLGTSSGVSIIQGARHD